MNDNTEDWLVLRKHKHLPGIMALTICRFLRVQGRGWMSASLG